MKRPLMIKLIMINQLQQ